MNIDKETFNEYFDFFEKTLVESGADIIHYKKLKRQTEIIVQWLLNSAVGYVEAVTGFGKSYIAILSIARLLKTFNNNASIIVVVPSSKLYNDWCKTDGYIERFNLKNVRVYIVNTYTMKENHIDYNCDFLICDELHNYCSDDADYFNTVLEKTEYRFMLGLTATLENSQKDFLKRLDIPCVATVSLAEARANNYVSDFDVYNYGIRLDTKQREIYDEISERHEKYFSKFSISEMPYAQFDLALACGFKGAAIRTIGGITKSVKDWREYIAKSRGYNGNPSHPFAPNKIFVYSKRWREAMQERKAFLDKHVEKIKAVYKIVNTVNRKTITFSESTEFADQLTLALSNSASYHSNLESIDVEIETVEYRKTLAGAKTLAKKLNSKILEYDEDKGYPISIKKVSKISKSNQLKRNLSKFENDTLQILNTAKALDEGADIPDIGCVIITSGTSKRRQYIQRIGRGIRFIEGKKTIIVNIYILDTKDEKWLKERQKRSKTPIYIEDVKQINLKSNVKGKNLLFDSN